MLYYYEKFLIGIKRFLEFLLKIISKIIIALNKLNKDLIEFEVDLREYKENKIFIHFYPKKNTELDKNLLKSLYLKLNSIEEYKNMSSYKIILISAISEEQIYQIGSSFIVTNDTTMEDFLDNMRPSIIKLRNRAYPIDVIEVLMVKVRKPIVKYEDVLKKNIGKRYYSTIKKKLDYRKYIIPLNKKKNLDNKIGVINLETFKDKNNKLIPYVVGYKTYKNETEENNIFYITDYEGININNQSDKMMIHFIQTLIKNDNITFYVQNLGEFEGLYLIKNMIKLFENKINILMDNNKNIISIELFNIKILDSKRIIPISLNDLCKSLNLEENKISFNHEIINEDYLNLKKNEILIYFRKDIKCFYNVIYEIRSKLFNDFKIDLNNSYSTSSLAMNIYRTNFLNDYVPKLPKHVTDFIKKSYKGGITDIYQCFGENLFYYDINSLYPNAMLKPMPFEFLGKKSGEEIILEEFFGFISASIYVPTNIKYPIFPVQNIDEVNYYPTGYIYGVYFSEELKYAKKLGCKIKIYKGYEFTKKIIFKEFVEHFYNLKKNKKDNFQKIWKLIMNGLYGYFGRINIRNKVDIINNENEINNIYSTYKIYNEIDITDKIKLIIRDLNPDKELCEKFNVDYKKESNKLYYQNQINSNLAIASAITSYARIDITKFKNIQGINVLYSDTDSIFTDKPLPSNIISNNIGDMKDVLNNDIIKQAYFISPKLYGYVTHNNNYKIVARGLPSNTLSFNELKEIYYGKSITKIVQRTYQDLDTFTLINKNINITITNSYMKNQKIPITLYNNIKAYKPIHISYINNLFK